MDNFKRKFLEEALEHINELERSLLELEVDPTDKEIIEKVFRAMHSLKGGGAMFGFERISEFTHDLETLYDFVRNDKMEVNKELLNVTLASIDHLKRLLNEEQEDQESLNKDHEYLCREISSMVKGVESPMKVVASPVAKTKIEKRAGFKSYHIQFKPHENIFDNGTNPLFLIDELYALGEIFIIPHTENIPGLKDLVPTNCYTYWDLILCTASEINAISDVFIFIEDDCTLTIHSIADQDLLKEPRFVEHLHQLTETNGQVDSDALTNLAVEIKTAADKKEKKPAVDRTTIVTKESTISSIRVSSDKLDLLMNLVSELVTTQARLSLYSESDSRPELVGIAENVQKLTRQLRDIAFGIVLIPIENILTRFQRLVRDLSSELKKDVVFIVEGADTELDKTIIENLTDPLMHILRNSLDHGIEFPEVRLKNGKPTQGKIMLRAFYSGANVHIQVSDDGAGIDPDFIREKAISKGIISPDTIMTRKDILDLIFLPGFSTAVNITDISGRGVGMDVVRRKIADIRGEVEVESEVNAGTTITIKLPLTLSIIDGLLVKIADINYIIPLSAVDKIYAVEHVKLKKAFNNIIVLDGEQVPFFYLRDEFTSVENTATMEEVVVVKYEDKRVGLAVDSVLGEYQAVLKPLGKHYKKQEIISGATILGDGTIALVLDTNKTIKQFSNQNIIVEEIK